MTTLAGRYELSEEIGRGGMAKVFKATDTRLERTVAVKVLAPQYARDDAFVARFQREAQAAARLNHPHIVSVYDSGSVGDVHYMVMEYVQGRTLAEILTQDHRLTPERSIEIAESVAEALTAAHSAGIVHRDVKPGNIMLTGRGDVKVMDFGIARMDTQHTVAQTQAVMGTASYLSPEQAQGGPVDARSDIYSLGVVLYEMLTGKPPFAGDSAVSVAVQHVREAPVPPSQATPGIPASLDAIVMRALAKNPANRYQSAGDLGRDLEGARLGQRVAAPPVLPAGATQVLPAAGPPEVVEPPSAGSRWAIGILIALILAAFAFGAFLLGRELLGGQSGGSPTPSVGPIKVPSLEGLTQSDAQSRLQDLGLVLGIVKPRATDAQAPGRIFKQDPVADDTVPAGTPVDVWVAEQPTASSPPTETPSTATAVVPDVRSFTQSEAKKALKDAGFEVGDVTEQPSDTVPAGQVISQDPKSGVQYQTGAPVDLVLSSGTAPIEVPDLTCLTLTQAAQELSDLGLNMAAVAPPTPNSDCPVPNRVGSQDTPPGTEVVPGAVVDIHISGP